MFYRRGKKIARYEDARGKVPREEPGPGLFIDLATMSARGNDKEQGLGFLIILIPFVAVSLLLRAALLSPVRRGMSKIRIPSVVVSVLGLVLMQSADRLSGPRDAKGDQTDQQFRAAAGTGGGLICLFAAAGLLYSRRKRTIRY